MPGLNLRGATTGAGYTATAASPPSASGLTITQQAYGTAAGGAAGGPSTARNGTLIAGVAGMAVLLFLWFTLPR